MSKTANPELRHPFKPALESARHRPPRLCLEPWRAPCPVSSGSLMETSTRREPRTQGGSRPHQPAVSAASVITKARTCPFGQRSWGPEGEERGFTKTELKDFSGGPVARPPCSPHRESGFDSAQGTRSHMLQWQEPKCCQERQRSYVLQLRFITAKYISF